MSSFELIGDINGMKVFQLRRTDKMCSNSQVKRKKYCSLKNKSYDRPKTKGRINC